MTKPDPFGFDMSVSSAKKRSGGTRRARTGASETSTRICDHENCREPGKFRAPKSPDLLDEYYWFCQRHVREYNLQWNYFDGTAADPGPLRSKDIIRDRVTHPPGDSEARAWARLGIEDPHQVLGDKATMNPGGGTINRHLPSTERRALEILEAKTSWTKAEVRRAYKALIKILHPDMNGGDRSHEEQLQEVFWAWNQIKDSRNFN